MKFKTNDPEKKSKMDKDLYDLFIDLIQFEIEKITFIKSASKYFDLNGYQDYDGFFKDIERDCSEFKECICNYLLNRLEILPDFKCPAIDVDFSNAQQVFDLFASLEEDGFEKLNELAKKALDVLDMGALAYLLKKLSNFSHIACRAKEAVKNNQPVRDLLLKNVMPW